MPRTITRLRSFGQVRCLLPPGGMVKRDDKVINASRASVPDTSGNPAEPGCSQETGDSVDFHETHYRPEMGTIVRTDDRLKSDGR
jgi:hypothetical protein